MEPWGNLFCRTRVPAGYRKKIIDFLVDIYYRWERQIKEKHNEYYLRIWLYYPYITMSQVVAAIAGKINYYETLFPGVDDQTNANIADDYATSRVNKLNWSQYDDVDYFLESDLMLKEPNNVIYYYNKGLVKKLIENSSFDLTASGEKMYHRYKGIIWVNKINM